MRRTCLFVLLAVLLALAPPPAGARILGDPGISFSADRTLTVGGRTFIGKLYSEPGAQRHEQAIEGVEQVIILHGAEARGWLILPGINSYVEFGFAPVLDELRDDSLLSTPLGTESVDGYATTKYRIEHTARNGAMVDGYLWLTREGIPMRLDGMYTPAGGGDPTPVTMRLSHIRKGPLDAALFAAPQHMVRLPFGALGPLLGLRPAG
ncbi:MAG TPA: hypothetical protein VFA50_11235 [Stellaceae bacterium]|nr:hypothetical protein [Stellaceae bacterium]